jgi:O-antigen/teichoic acid export membrane protein
MNGYNQISGGERFNLIEKVRFGWRLIRNSKLISNASIYVMGSMLQKAAAFLLIPLYTRYLTPSDYGIIGLAQSIQGVFSLLIGLGLYSAVARLYFDFRDEPSLLKSFISSNFLFISLFALISTIIFTKWGKVLWDQFSGGQVSFSPYIQLALLLAFSDVIFLIPVTLYRAAQRATAFVTAHVSVFLFGIAIIIFLVVIKRMGAEGMLIGDLIANLLVASILVFLLLREYFTPHFHWKYVRSSLKFSMPLVPHTIASWALIAIDRILLESGGISLDQIGLYNLGYQLGMIMSILVYSINQAWSPYYYDLMKRMENPESKIRHMILFYVAIMGGICLVGILFSREFVHLIAPDRYQGAEIFVSPILFGHLLLGFYYLASVPLFYFKRTSVIPIITLVGAVTNILLNLWWIPTSGAIGSAWATAISYGITFGLALIMSFRYQRIELPFTKLSLMIGLVFAAVIWTTIVNGAQGFSELKLVYYLVKAGFLVAFMLLAIVWLAKPAIESAFQKSQEYVL